jgi:hypothetical protein
MIPYTHLHLLPLFKSDMRHFSLSNSTNILQNTSDPERIIKQLNGHLDAINDPKVHQKIFDSKTTQFNDSFVKQTDLDKNFKNDFLKERFRPNLFGLGDLRRIVDMGFKYHRAIATKDERDIIDHYTQLEDEYYNKVYIDSNLDEPE